MQRFRRISDWLALFGNNLKFLMEGKHVEGKDYNEKDKRSITLEV